VRPRLVREETVAKYRHLLDLQTKRAAQAVKDLNRLIVRKNSQIHFAPPKSVHAARKLRDKFREVEKAGLIRYYPDVNGVDVNEVFLSGVKRRRPANKDGEELRDVIIWLIALQYADKEKKQIALVSNDGGFWNDTEIHEHLKQDIDERKVNVSRGQIAGNSLLTISVSPKRKFSKQSTV
jgi:PIN domain